MNTLSLNAASWEQLPDLPEPAGGFICGKLGHKLAFVGGTSWRNDTKIWRDSIWTYEPAKKVWQEAGQAPQPIAYAGFGEMKSALYFVGGSDGQKTHAVLAMLDSSLQIRKIAADSCALLYSGAALSDGKLFVLGGADTADFKNLTNGFFAIGLKSGKMQNLPAYPGGKLILPATTAVKDQIFAFTGADIVEGKAINTNAAFVYSIKEAKWRPIKSYPQRARGVAACALDGRYILLGGGYENDFVDTAFIYDTKSDSYYGTVNLPYRAMANFIKAGRYVYWMGGEDKPRHRSAAAYRIPWKELIASRR